MHDHSDNSGPCICYNQVSMQRIAIGKKLRHTLHTTPPRPGQKVGSRRATARDAKRWSGPKPWETSSKCSQHLSTDWLEEKWVNSNGGSYCTEYVEHWCNDKRLREPTAATSATKKSKRVSPPSNPSIPAERNILDTLDASSFSSSLPLQLCSYTFFFPFFTVGSFLFCLWYEVRSTAYSVVYRI